jgi:DNA topoisomerase I (EC 5.99.1.2)
LQTEEGETSIKANIPLDFTPADLVPEKIAMLLKQKLAGPDQLGTHPETGEPIFVLTGQYGPYVQLGEATEQNPKPRRASLPKGITPETLTLEMAVNLLKLPRVLGTHPETGCKIEANNGRFGPFIVHDRGKEGKDYRSLKGDDDPYTITLERALELLSQPKVGRVGTAKVLKSLGTHPDTGEELVICEGKYGAYLKHGKSNITLPKGTDIEDFGIDQAIALVADSAPTPSKSARTATSTLKSTAKSRAKATKAKAAS